MRAFAAVLLRRWPRLLILFAAGILAGSAGLDRSNPLELFLTDARFTVAAAMTPPGAQSDSIAVILVDSRSAEALGADPGTTAWRRFHPGLIATLKEAGAALIVFDSQFGGSEPELDGALARSMTEAGNVVAGEFAPGSTAPSLRGSFLVIGGLTIGSFRDKMPRFIRFPSAEDPLQPLCATVAGLLAARNLARPAVPPPGGRLWIGFDRALRRDAVTGSYAGSWYRAFSYIDIYRSADGRTAGADRTPLSLFAGKTVFIGLDDPISDRFAFPGTLGVPYPGVFGQAFALHSLLDGPRVEPPGLGADLLLLGAFTAVLCLLLGMRGGVRRTALLVLLPVAALAGGTVLFVTRGAWLALGPPLLAFPACLALHWVIRRAALSSSLRQAIGFDPALIDAFRRESARTGGRVARDVAVLVADVRDYTGFVARGEPGRVADVMTAYMAAMEKAVGAQGGYVNKYVGDEIVAVFGFPLPDESKETRAVRAALAMLAALESLKEAWRGEGGAFVERIGIGIDAGSTTFAEVGGGSKSQFDIIGNCINGAARLQAFTKECGRALVISEQAFRALGADGGLPERFLPLGETAIRGQGTRSLYGLEG